MKSSVFSLWGSENDPKFLSEAQFNFDKKVSISYDIMKYDSDAEYKVLIYCGEPNVISNIDSQVISNQNQFDLILTWRDNILKECKNSQRFLFGGPRTVKDSKLNLDKKNEISYLTSSKNYTEGHRFRQRIWNFFNDHDFGGDYKISYYRSPPRIDKEIIFNNAKFSIVVENSKQKNYFSEKITDCLSTKTIPIYCGCENIFDFFDSNGFIIFNTLDELISIISNLNSDYYESKLNYVEKNYQESKKYWDYYGRIKKKIEENLNE